MVRFLYYVTYSVVICFLTKFSLPGVASESEIAVIDEKTALELGYGTIQAYKCDKELNQLVFLKTK